MLHFVTQPLFWSESQQAHIWEAVPLKGSVKGSEMKRLLCRQAWGNCLEPQGAQIPLHFSLITQHPFLSLTLASLPSNRSLWVNCSHSTSTLGEMSRGFQDEALGLELSYAELKPVWISANTQVKVQQDKHKVLCFFHSSCYNAHLQQTDLHLHSWTSQSPPTPAATPGDTSPCEVSLPALTTAAMGCPAALGQGSRLPEVYHLKHSCPILPL